MKTFVWLSPFTQQDLSNVTHCWYQESHKANLWLVAYMYALCPDRLVEMLHGQLKKLELDSSLNLQHFLVSAPGPKSGCT